MLTKLRAYMGDDLPFFAAYGAACGAIGWVVIELLRRIVFSLVVS